MPCFRMAARRPSMIWLRRGPARLGRPIDSLVTKPIYQVKMGSPATRMRPFATVPPCSPRATIACASPRRSIRFRGRAGWSACRRSSSARPAATCAASGATRRTRRGSPRASGGRSTELVAAVPAHARHVVVTGGEPLLWSNLPRLTAALRAAGRHVTIETAGTVFQALDVRSHVDLAEARQLRSRARSDRRRVRADHAARRLDRDVLRRLLDRYACQLKFVVAEPGDLERSTRSWRCCRRSRPESVLLMPLGVRRAAEVAAARALARGAVQGARLPLYAAAAHRSVRRHPRHVTEDR